MGVEAIPAESKIITLDFDATDDPLHGAQEGRHFHGYYKNYCYLPLYVFCGEHLLAARLRPSNIDGSAGALNHNHRSPANPSREPAAIANSANDDLAEIPLPDVLHAPL